MQKKRQTAGRNCRFVDLPTEFLSGGGGGVDHSFSLGTDLL